MIRIKNSQHQVYEHDYNDEDIYALCRKFMLQVSDNRRDLIESVIYLRIFLYNCIKYMRYLL